MTSHEDIAAIQAGMARRCITGDLSGTRAQPTTDAREGRRILDALATQFNTYLPDHAGSAIEATTDSGTMNCVRGR